MNNSAISDLLQMSIAERFQLAEDLWDSVAAEVTAEPDRLPVTDEQRQEIAHRSEAHQKNPNEAFPLDEALERIERLLG